MNDEAMIYAQWTEKTRKYYENKGYIFTKYGDLFGVTLNDFSSTSKKIVKVRCGQCNKYFDMEFRNYYQRIVNSKPTQCYECILESKRDRLYQDVVNICNQKDYQLITTRDDIVDRQTEIYYICSKHGETHTRISSLLVGKGCYWCGRENASKHMVKTTLQSRQDCLYKKVVEMADAKGYILHSSKTDIVNNTSYIRYSCPKHGLHKMRVANFIYGKGCPDCVPEKNSERFRLLPDDVEKRIELLGGRLLNKEEYKNQTEKNLWVICIECGEPFLTSLRNYTQHGGQVCGNCCGVESVGEKRIRIYLESNEIKFIPQKWFSDCRDINPLPFDFYLPDYNVIIEFDGRQHFEETDYFTYSFEKTKTHDKIKNDYCKVNGIYLIRIPYWNMDKIEQILDNELILHEDIV